MDQRAAPEVAQRSVSGLSRLLPRIVGPRCRDCGCKCQWQVPITSSLSWSYYWSTLPLRVRPPLQPTVFRTPTVDSHGRRCSGDSSAFRIVRQARAPGQCCSSSTTSFLPWLLAASPTALPTSRSPWRPTFYSLLLLSSARVVCRQDGCLPLCPTVKGAHLRDTRSAEHPASTHPTRGHWLPPEGLARCVPRISGCGIRGWITLSVCCEWLGLGGWAGRRCPEHFRLQVPRYSLRVTVPEYQCLVQGWGVVRGLPRISRPCRCSPLQLLSSILAMVY